MIVWLICLCLFWVTIFRMLHNATPHYDNGKHSSQPKVTQKSHICIKNQSCKPCSQSENCCPTISHYNTPFHYDSFSMLTGLSIPYSLTKDHCYMSELSLFPAYVRTDIRSDWPETHSIGRMLMSALYVANPKVYNGVMRKLERLQDEWIFRDCKQGWYRAGVACCWMSLWMRWKKHVRMCIMIWYTACRENRQVCTKLCTWKRKHRRF